MTSDKLDEEIRKFLQDPTRYPLDMKALTARNPQLPAMASPIKTLRQERLDMGQKIQLVDVKTTALKEEWEEEVIRQAARKVAIEQETKATKRKIQAMV